MRRRHRLLTKVALLLVTLGFFGATYLATWRHEVVVAVLCWIVAQLLYIHADKIAS